MPQRTYGATRTTTTILTSSIKAYLHGASDQGFYPANVRRPRPQFQQWERAEASLTLCQTRRYREDLDVHLSTCRAQDIKEQKIDSKNQEFMRAIMSYISNNESLSNMNDDEKRAYIIGRVKALVKERDEAIRKDAPL
jgi:hypothetical protein